MKTLLISFILFFGTIPAQALVCSQLHQSSETRISFGFEDIDSRKQVFTSEQNVQIVGTQKLAQGKRYTLKKDPKTDWGSFYAPSNNSFATHLNPMWPVYILQGKLASFLEIRVIDGSTMSVPDAHLYNSRIKALNKLLEAKGLEPISASFYNQAEAKAALKNYDSYAEMFVRRFVEKNEFPLAEDEQIHDVAVHVLNILFTKDFMRPMKIRGQALNKLMDAVRSGEYSAGLSSDIFTLPEFREVLVRTLYRIYSKEIDNYSGQIPWTMGSYLVNDINTAKQRYGVYYQGGIATAMAKELKSFTLLGWLKEQISYSAGLMIESKDPDSNSSWSTVINLEKEKDILEYLTDNAAQISTDLQTIATRLRKNNPEFDQNFALLLSRHDFTYGLSTINNRLVDLQETVGSQMAWPRAAPLQIESQFRNPKPIIY